MWRTLAYFDIGLGCIYPVVLALLHTFPPDVLSVFAHLRILLAGMSKEMSPAWLMPGTVYPGADPFGCFVGTAFLEVAVRAGLDPNPQLRVEIYSGMKNITFKAESVFSYRLEKLGTYKDWEKDFETVLPSEWWSMLENFLMAIKSEDTELTNEMIKNLILKHQ